MKKIPTLFVRDFGEGSNGRYVTEQVNPGCEWVLAGRGRPTRKWDGTCVRVVNGGGLYEISVRREVKPDRPEPDGYELVEIDGKTGKKVGWEPWSNSPFAAFIEEARQTWAAEHPLPDPWHSDIPTATYELIGPKINGNPDRSDVHRLVRHGAELFPAADRSYEGIRAALLTRPEVEGIVFWRDVSDPNSDRAKIKRKDFRVVPSTGETT
jgi:hypothetical protein